jgi:hypothetical protein
MEWVGLVALVLSAVLLMWPGGGALLFRNEVRNDPLTAAFSSFLAR